MGAIYHIGHFDRLSDRIVHFGRVLYHHKGICFGRVGYDRDRLRPGSVNGGERPERWFIFNDIIPRCGKILLAQATFSDSGAGSIRVFLLHLLPGFFGGGTGNPFFSTDTTTALRAVEVSADIMFKATMVDGVYDKDPHKYPDAKKYDTLTFTKVLEDQLAVMDGTAATLCRDNKLPILVFDLADPDNIAKAVQGENVGTLVYEG